jgi:hypothetical protein
MLLFLLFSCNNKQVKSNKNLPMTNRSFIQKMTVLRNKPINSANIVLELIEFDEIKILQKGKEDTIDNQKDFWYQVKTKKNIIGWVFGADTSLKQSGQITAFLSFENYDFGDLEHYIFIDKKNKITLDFGQGNNNFGAFDFIFLNEEQEEYTGNPKYMGKEFKVTYNNLIAKVYCDYPIDTNICIKQVPTIIQIQIIE